MSERLPYDEQIDQAWDRLQLPDEDMAWKDMKRRLDEDDDEKIVIPPPRRGCGLGILLIGLLLAGGLWFLLRPEKWFEKKDPVISDKVQSEKEKDKDKVMTTDNRIEHSNKTSTLTTPGPNDQQKTGSTSITSQAPTNVTNDQSRSQSTIIATDNTKIEGKDATVKNNSPRSLPLAIKRNPPVQKQPLLANPKSKKSSGGVAKTGISRENRHLKNDPSSDRIAKKDIVDDQDPIPAVANRTTVDTTQKKMDSSVTNPVEVKTGISSPIDPAIKKTTDSISQKQPEPVTKNTKPEKSKEKKPIFFSAGLGLHQQIPIAGQELTTYSSLGRKGILTDYIPSINFRMEQQDRWFLQPEFRYGAPQYTKQFTYEQTIDSSNQGIFTNSSVLKKSFYHQLPLTFSYYVLPNWSVGAGLQWNKFYSAVAEQEVKRRQPNAPIDSIISKGIMKVSNDSNSAFVKSWFQGVIQTQYQWKRFSIGARYSFGLQPYIRITLPNQPLQEEKNSSLQIFLRYELWKSKK